MHNIVCTKKSALIAAKNRCQNKWKNTCTQKYKQDDIIASDRIIKALQKKLLMTKSVVHWERRMNTLLSIFIHTLKTFVFFRYLCKKFNIDLRLGIPYCMSLPLYLAEFDCERCH